MRTTFGCAAAGAPASNSHNQNSFFKPYLW
jgi:hypothetical protein